MVYYFIETPLEEVAVLYRALLSQFVRQLESVPPITEGMFYKHKYNLSLRWPTSDQLGTMLMELLAFFRRPIFVIDGLDKADKQTLRAIFRFIRSASNQGMRIQLFGTSRVSLVVGDACWDRAYGLDHAERNRWRNSVKTLSIPRAITNEDIAKYVKTEIRSHPTSWLRNAETLTIDGKVDRIVHQSNGL